MNKKKNEMKEYDCKDEFYTGNNVKEEEHEKGNGEYKKKTIIKVTKKKDGIYDMLEKLNLESDLGTEENIPYEDTTIERPILLESDETCLASSNKEKLLEIVLEDILRRENILCINEQLYLYDKNLGYYKKIGEHKLKVIINAIIIDIYDKYAAMYNINEIADHLKINPYIQMDSDDINLNQNAMRINCKNGVIGLKNGEIKNHKPDYYFLNVINANYIDNFNYKKFKKSTFYKFINSITMENEELMNLLQEIMGYCICNLNNAKKYFVFYGVSNSGKSIMMDFLTFLCGEENISNIPLQKLSDEKYVGELFGKVLNLYSELSDKNIKDTGMIKSLVNDCDKITCRPMYKSPFSFKNKSKLLFSTNNLISIESNSEKDNEAFFNRIIIIPFMNSISEEDQDKNLIKKLKKEVDFVFTWAMYGLERYIENNFRFSECYESKKYLDEYKKNESIIERFIEDRIIFDEDYYIYQSDLFEEFKEFCREENKSSIGASNRQKRNLKDVLINKYKLEYTKIHRGNDNKYGFYGITI